LGIVWAFWVLVTILVLGLVITGIPIRYNKVKEADPDIRSPEFRDLIKAGVPSEAAAAYDLGVDLLVFIVLFGGGLLIFLRLSDSREAIFLSLTLILYGASFSALTSVHRTTGAPIYQSPLGVLATVQFFLQTSFTMSAIFWLPAGRFVPRWTAFLTALLIILSAGIYCFVGFPQSHNLVNIIGLPAVIIAVWAQIFHYRRVVNPITRQQIKWAVIGIVVAAFGFFLWQTATLVLGNQEGLMPRIYMVLARLILTASQIALPVCFAVAILRFRFWQADLVINRSLVYGAVTVLLVLVFLGGGLVLQGLLGRANSTISFAVSIVAAGLLFNPARKRMQFFVDRRLYGFRFDLNELNRAQQLPEIKTPGALTGRMLGKYRVLGVLGKGGMGEVYQGEGEGRIVAIKILPEELMRRADLRKRFEREAQALASFNHPNIVRFYELDESDGVYYMALEFIQGRELSDILKQQGRIPFNEIQPFIQDVASALDYVHEQGFVHRDIKPSNIMVRPKANGKTLEAVLMDFGIAKIKHAHTALTDTGAVGTINYMAPEQIMAARMVDLRADIYSLGVIIYELLTGELPFNGNPGQVLFAHLQQPPPNLGELVPDLPPIVVKGVMRALEKKPEDRFESAGEFITALSRA